MNDHELTDIYARRNRVLDLEDQWDVDNVPPGFDDNLLDAAVASSADVDALMAELSKLSRGRIALWKNGR